METFDPVGVLEVAERLGVSRQLVAQWHKRGKLPPPDAVVSGGPCWKWSTIEAWRDAQQRPPA